MRGQHNHQILAGIGYRDDEIAKLEANHVIWVQFLWSDLRLRHLPWSDACLGDSSV